MSVVVFFLFVFIDIGKRLRRGKKALNLRAPALHPFDIPRRNSPNWMSRNVVLYRI
jgi:hypothetical protein